MEYDTYIPRILIRWSLNCLNVKHRFYHYSRMHFHGGAVIKWVQPNIALHILALAKDHRIQQIL